MCLVGIFCNMGNTLYVSPFLISPLKEVLKLNIKYVQPDIENVDTTDSRYQKLMDYLESERQQIHVSKERRVGVIQVVPRSKR